MKDAVGAAVRIIDDVRDAVAPAIAWPAWGSLADVSLDGAVKRAKLGKSIVQRIAALDRAELPANLAQTIDVIGSRATFWVTQEEWYWTAFDPGGAELFGMFAPTAYCGGMVVSSITNALVRAPVGTEASRFRYLAGLAELGDLLDEFALRTRGQAERGIHMPRPQAEAAVALLERLKRAQPATLGVGPERLAGEEGFMREVDRITADRVVGGLQRMADVLDPGYFGRTSEAIGMMHFPQGEAIYAALVRLHGSTTLSPAEVHRVGLDRMREVRAAMAKARRAAGFAGDDLAYRAHLDADPKWRADTPEAIGAVFERYIARFRPHFDALFNIRPKADYGVRPLPHALSASMTFGYYEPPGAASPRGDYVFNAANLASSGLHTVAALNYHELVPGHHLHLALQRENEALPAIRQWSMPTAYVEGWAEYAVTLAEEAGMFEDPAEQFGRLLSEAFLVSRLVVDTGMNALGWSLDQARAYMRENSFFPGNQIASETLRYGADIPGQALAYKLGDRAIMGMREAMRTKLGDRFDIRAFHDAVLTAGALPLPLLATHVDTVMTAHCEGLTV